MNPSGTIKRTAGGGDKGLNIFPKSIIPKV